MIQLIKLGLLAGALYWGLTTYVLAREAPSASVGAAACHPGVGAGAGCVEERPGG